MRIKATREAIIIACTCLGLNLMTSGFVRGQERPIPVTVGSSLDTRVAGDHTLAELIYQLQAQVQGLNSQVGELRVEERSARAETIALRKELDVAKAQLASLTCGTQGQAGEGMCASPVQSKITESSAPSPAFRETTEPQSTGDRIAKLEEDLQLANQKINEQSQTKVEGGAKYRLRLSGIVLLNLFSNRGALDNEDFPEVATPRPSVNSGAAFGGSLRQSQISLQAFGPDIAGARTSADLRLDFAGGFPATSNGTTMGVARLRTGAVHFDWSKTSIVAGQDNLFFSPLSPTSLASLAVPALSYSGNLWAWTPQVRVDHRFAVSNDSSLLLQAGVLASISGEVTDSKVDRLPTQGEQSGQPAYAARIAWSERLLGQAITAGIGGYYGRQNWGVGRTVNAWIGSADLVLPLGKQFEFSGEFYRGRAAGGFGGAVGQTVLLNGPLSNAGTTARGLGSMGGWIQLKFKPTPKFEVNAAFGDDSPFSSELRSFTVNASDSGSRLSKNLSPFINFIYQPRSDVVFSTEYRHLKTFVLDSNPSSANLINFSIGYIF